MIMVIYHWEVTDENRTAFIDAWRATTQLVHKSTEGVLGSICLSKQSDNRQIMTLARWSDDSLWRDFIESAKSGKMQEMHRLAKLTITVLCNEVGDQLKRH